MCSRPPDIQTVAQFDVIERDLTLKKREKTGASCEKRKKPKSPRESERPKSPVLNTCWGCNFFLRLFCLKLHERKTRQICSSFTSELLSHCRLSSFRFFGFFYFFPLFQKKHKNRKKPKLDKQQWESSSEVKLEHI